MQRRSPTAARDRVAAAQRARAAFAPQALDFGRRGEPLWVVGRQIFGTAVIGSGMLMKHPGWWPALLVFSLLLGASIVHTLQMAPYPRYRLTDQGIERYRLRPRPSLVPWSELAGPVECESIAIVLRRNGRRWRLHPWQLEADEREALRRALRERLERRA